MSCSNASGRLLQFWEDNLPLGAKEFSHFQITCTYYQVIVFALVFKLGPMSG